MAPRRLSRRTCITWRASVTGLGASKLKELFATTKTYPKHQTKRLQTNLPCRPAPASPKSHLQPSNLWSRFTSTPLPWTRADLHRLGPKPPTTTCRPSSSGRDSPQPTYPRGLDPCGPAPIGPKVHLKASKSRVSGTSSSHTFSLDFTSCRCAPAGPKSTTEHRQHGLPIRRKQD